MAPTPHASACPKCAGTMVRRTARKGAHAGDSFWGCAAFPQCRGTA
ncbi:MAG: topoisomerase DNA-binding C4 zinc finger domain-containing protein [Variovorax sp.]